MEPKFTATDRLHSIFCERISKLQSITISGPHSCHLLQHSYVAYQLTITIPHPTSRVQRCRRQSQLASKLRRSSPVQGHFIILIPQGLSESSKLKRPWRTSILTSHTPYAPFDLASYEQGCQHFSGMNGCTSIKYEYDVVSAMLMYGYANMCEMLLWLMSCALAVNYMEREASGLTTRW